MIVLVSIAAVSCGGGLDKAYNDIVGDFVHHPVTGVILQNGVFESIHTGAVVTLHATVLPADASDTKVTWSIVGGSSYAEIDPGTGTLIAGTVEGNVTIQAVTREGSFTAQKTIPVTNTISSELSVLIASDGTLQPAFDHFTTTYLDAPVPSSHSAASIIAVASQGGSLITCNGEHITSGLPVKIPGLHSGSNSVSIEVTAADGVTKKSYFINIYRAVPVYKTGAGTIVGYTSDPREDGAVRRGVEWPKKRFVDNGDGTITDNLSHLVWIKDVSVFPYSLNWEYSLLACENLSYAQADDWRLPNVRELLSVCNWGASSYSWLIGSGFTGLPVNMRCWSSSSDMATPANGWFLWFDNSLNSELKTAGAYATLWPVRSSGPVLPSTGQSTLSTGDDGYYHIGVAAPSIRICDMNDGTLVDNMTGLIWIRNAGISGIPVTWQEGLDYIDGLNTGSKPGNSGYHDWRLPTINEMITLLDYGYAAGLSAWMSSKGFQNVPAGASDVFATSTTDVRNTGNAWSVSAYDNSVSSTPKINGFYIIPVRESR